ncbi:MAG: hypothetical protein JJT96_01110 [Opitutales bacterium]|nr:hypothetical protein [Opitutales bacterium]
MKHRHRHLSLSLPTALTLVFCTLGLSLPVAPAARAQPLENTLFAAATTTLDEHGRAWAYLSWAGSDLRLLENPLFAIYVKESPADDLSANYQAQALIGRQTEPATVAALLERGRMLGEDLDLLEQRLDGLFAQYVPSPDISLPEKLAAIVLAAEFLPEVERNLALLARQHPSAAMASGTGWASRLPVGATWTYEVRLCPPDTVLPGECTRVVARLSVTGGDPVILPAPGAPADLSWRDPRGHLNIRIAWATPPALRQLALLQTGFDIYRVDPDFYAVNYAGQTLEPGRLAADEQASSHLIRRANNQPIFPERNMDQSELNILAALSLDGEEVETFFFADDNDAFAPGGAPFQDGDQFYYMVVARDLLGRSGLSSPGTLMTVCSRYSPPVPEGIRVEVLPQIGADGENDPVFRIVWTPNDNADPESIRTDAYFVYRWRNPNEIFALNDPFDPAHLAAAFITHEDEVAFLIAEDLSPARPRLLPGDPEDAANLTHWYTVRAVNLSACPPGLVLSGHSAPVSGVLRHWDPPGDPSGELFPRCPSPSIDYVGTNTFDATANPFYQRHQLVGLRCQRTGDDGIEWVEYYIGPFTDDPAADRAQADFFQRVYFPEGAAYVDTFPVFRGGVDGPPPGPTLAARVGTRWGSVSEWTGVGQIGISPGFFTLSTFNASLTLSEAKAGDSCRQHLTVDPATGEVTPLRVLLNLPVRTREYKVYTRFNDGPLALVAQWLGDYREVDEVEVFLDQFPGMDGTLCVYYQNFDAEGTPGLLVQLGCVELTGLQPMPPPMVARARRLTETPASMSVGGEGSGEVFGSFSDDPAASPGIELTWFCPPHGVERFEIWIARADGNPLPDDISDDLYSRKTTVANYGGVWDVDFSVYETGRVGVNIGERGSPEFSALLALDSAAHHHVFIRSIGPSGRASVDSNIVRIGGTLTAPPPDPEAQVPWPARQMEGLGGNPLAVALAGYRARFVEIFPDTTFHFRGGAIRIGRTNMPSMFQANNPILPPSGPPWHFTIGHLSPELQLFGVPDLALIREGDRGLLPIVVYRYQVPGGDFPEVSGDIYQVTPLMRNIAAEYVPEGALPGGGNEFVQTPYWAIFDPYIAVVPGTGSNPNDWDIVLIDPQSTVRGAHYRYLIARFDDEGELLAIYPTNILEVP